MSATVFKGTGRPVLDYLCGIYAILEVERQDKEIIVAIDQARESLTRHVHDNNITADEATELERVMLGMKLKNDGDVVLLLMIERALDFMPPSNFSKKLGFQSKHNTHHVPRGVVNSASGRTLSHVITNLSQGVFIADQLVCSNSDLTYVDGVELFQQMIYAKLAVNPKGESELYNKLAEELEEFLTDADVMGDDIQDREPSHHWDQLDY